MSGLSPLARGGQTRIAVCSLGTRVIPACAGWTRSVQLPLSSRPGYPRLRGVDYWGRYQKSSNCGLSPLARGGRGRAGCRLYGVRVIPACAGWTVLFFILRIANAGYPRLRGVDCGRAASYPAVLGLSPLARGGRINFSFRNHNARVIPACAGWTLSLPVYR